MEEMEIQVLGNKLGKARGSLIVNGSCNQALEGGTSFKQHKANQAHPHVCKRKKRNNVQ